MHFANVFPKTVLLILLGLFCSCVAAQDGYQRVSVCEVQAHLKSSISQNVEVRADLVNAWHHGIFLIDQRCPKKSLQLDYSLVDAEQGVANLNKLLLSGDLLKGATGIFRGQIRRDHKTRRLYLLLQSVQSLQLKGTSSSESDALPPIDQIDMQSHESGHVIEPPKQP